MQKISTVSSNGNRIFEKHQRTVGLDLGDRSSCYCLLDENGEIILAQKVTTIPEAMQQAFGKMLRSRIAMETGTQGRRRKNSRRRRDRRRHCKSALAGTRRSGVCGPLRHPLCARRREWQAGHAFSGISVLSLPSPESLALVPRCVNRKPPRNPPQFAASTSPPGRCGCPPDGTAGWSQRLEEPWDCQGRVMAVGRSNLAR